MGSSSSKYEGYEGHVIIETNNIPEEYTLFMQHTRKNLLLKQFNEYIENTDQYSIYHKHYVGTKVIVSLNGTTIEYKLISTIFFTLWHVDNTNYYESNKTVDWIN
jgi:hypothetical protein